MIHARKTAAIVSAVVGVALTMSVRSQEPEESRARSSPESSRKESDRSPPHQGDRFVAPPGLSEEAIRSFRELPPGNDHEAEGVSVPEAIPSEKPGPPDLPADRGPFDSLPAPPEPAAPSGSTRPTPSRATPGPDQPRPEYVVEPPDMLIVEVLEALPGRPISGERLVRPDGRISLGFYGEIPVAGLTIPQIKERIVLHLRKFINDDILGIVEREIESGKIRRDQDGQVIVKAPGDSDRIFVDVTAYNSQHCYVLGEVAYPGSLPYTGGDTVLDLLQYAGGLHPTADRARIKLIRSFPKGSPARVLPVDYEEIAMGTDSSTNYPILPNDRLVVARAGTGRPDLGMERAPASGERPSQDAGAARVSGARITPNVERNAYFDRNGYLASRDRAADIEGRIAELEKKLDRLIEVLQQSRPEPAGEAVRRPSAESMVAPDGPEEAGAMERAPRRPMEETVEEPAPRRPAPRRVGPAGPHRPRRESPAGARPGSRPSRPGAERPRPTPEP